MGVGTNGPHGGRGLTVTVTSGLPPGSPGTLRRDRGVVCSLTSSKSLRHESTPTPPLPVATTQSSPGAWGPPQKAPRGTGVVAAGQRPQLIGSLNSLKAKPARMIEVFPFFFPFKHTLSPPTPQRISGRVSTLWSRPPHETDPVLTSLPSQKIRAHPGEGKEKEPLLNGPPRPQ